VSDGAALSPNVEPRLRLNLLVRVQIEYDDRDDGQQRDLDRECDDEMPGNTRDRGIAHRDAEAGASHPRHQ
jgi:hypothetical protein